MAAFDEATIRWLTVLVGAIIVSLLSVLLPNRYQLGRKPRSHNGIKLLNECLARHQLVYLTYFLALVMTANFGPELSWFRNTLGVVGIPLVILFYSEGVWSTTKHDEWIKQHHICVNDECNEKLPGRLTFRIYGLSLTFAVLSLAGGLLAALLAR